MLVVLDKYATACEQVWHINLKISKFKFLLHQIVSSQIVYMLFGGLFHTALLWLL